MVLTTSRDIALAGRSALAVSISLSLSILKHDRSDFTIFSNFPVPARGAFRGKLWRHRSNPDEHIESNGFEAEEQELCRIFMYI
jgi:hypothetical protein